MILILHLSVPPPVEPSISVVSITATSISLSWSVPTDQMVTSSEVIWQVLRNETAITEADSDGISGSINVTSYMYTIYGLKSSTSYRITVTVTNIAGNNTSSLVVITTEGK